MTEKTFWERFNASLENQKRLIASTDYFDWLYEFTKKHPKFTDTSWQYTKDESMSATDHSQVELLTDFFTAIDQYHRKNLLKVNMEGYACWYNVKYKDTYFAIGMIVGQGATSFVTRHENYEAMEGEVFIDFEYILGQQAAPGLVKKQQILQRVQADSDKLRDLGTPKSAVLEVIEKSFAKK